MFAHALESRLVDRRRHEREPLSRSGLRGLVRRQARTVADVDWGEEAELRSSAAWNAAWGMPSEEADAHGGGGNAKVRFFPLKRIFAKHPEVRALFHQKLQ